MSPFSPQAKGQRLGRMAAQIATLLQGKDKPTYHPTALNGDIVVVTNCKHVELSGRKWVQHEHTWYTGYPGGLKSKTALEVWKDKPEALLEEAVYGMLPRNKLRKHWMRRLRLYPDNAHDFSFLPHGAAPGHLLPTPLTTKRYEGGESVDLDQDTEGTDGSLRATIIRRRTPTTTTTTSSSSSPIPLLDRHRAHFWARTHRPDGEQHWAAEVAEMRDEVERRGVAWRTGLADSHGKAGGPHGYLRWKREQEALRGGGGRGGGEGERGEGDGAGATPAS